MKKILLWFSEKFKENKVKIINIYGNLLLVPQSTLEYKIRN